MLGSATTSLAVGSSLQYSQRRHFVIVLKRMTRETLPLLLRYARKGVSDLRRSHGRLLPGCRACLVAAEIAERCILPNAPWLAGQVSAKLRLPAAVGAPRGGAGAVPGSSLSSFVNSLGTMQMTMHCCASLMSAAGFLPL